MDKILLNALNNLSDSLELIAAALKKGKSNKGGPNSATGSALTKGDFGGQLKEISVEVRSIKKDTQEILRQQKTILEISKKKEKDKKTGIFEEAGGDKKSESSLKKGIGTILLIAVAVLAIGLAFKIVGKVDFLSVISLSIAMYAISLAFEKVAKLKLSLKESFTASLTLVMMATAVTMSSWIMKLISPISLVQTLTAILIAAMFAVMAAHLENIFIAAGIFSKLRVSKTALLIALVSISAAITMSSWILKLITPISFTQALTGILISAMFAVVALNLDKIVEGVAVFDKLRISKIVLITTLVGIAAAITMSSWILTLVMPLSLGKAITAILISAMFLVISLNFEKIAVGIAAFDKFNIKKTVLILTLVGIATAITLSSWILALINPIGLFQFLTALGIALLFALMSYVMPQLAAGVYVMEKALGKKGLFLMPLIFVAISLAIMISSHILAMTADIELGRILKIALFGVALAIMVLAMMPSVLLVGIAVMSGVGAGAIALGVLMIPLIAAAIAVSSHILAIGKYDKFPDWRWSIGVGLSITGFAAAAVILGSIALTGVGALAILAGVLLVPLIALSIVMTDKVISKGKYNKYPGLGWVLTVGVLMTGFGVAVLTLGLLAVTGIGLVAILAGVLLVPLIAVSIVMTDKVLAKGKYNKYPGLGWILSVGASMTGFGIAVLALGLLAVTGIGLVAILAGVLLVPLIAETIVATDKVIAKGKYNKYPGLGWILSVGASMTGFGIAVVALGVIALTGFGLGALAIIAGTKMVPKIAQTIVDTDRVIGQGKYDKYPGWEWALSVGSLMTIFGAAVVGVGAMIVGSFGLGYLAIEVGSKAVNKIAESIVSVGYIFAKSGLSWKKGPTKEWAEGVAIALGAFSPVYKMLIKGGIMEIFTGSGPNPFEFAEAIKTISQGIVDAANFFGAPGMTDVYKGGPTKEWAEGVGNAIGAFSPVYSILAKEKGWFGTGVSIEKFKKAILTISGGIVEAAGVFGENKAKFDEGNYPSAEWGQGVGGAIAAFAPVFKGLSGAGWFQSGDSVINDMVNGIRKISYSIVEIGGIFSADWINWDKYPTNTWSWNLKTVVWNFAQLSKSVEEFDLSTVSNVIIISYKMAEVAKTFALNKKYFDTKIDPNFTKNIRHNILDFNNLVKELTKSQDKGIIGNIRSMADGLLGTDPISQIARKMITLAKGYDTLAKSLIKLGFAMKTLNIKNLAQLGGATRSLVSGGDKERQEVEGRRFVPRQNEQMSTVGEGLKKDRNEDKDKKLPPELAKRNHIYYMSQKLDQVVDLLGKINVSTSTIDDFITLQTNGKIKSPTDISRT